MDHEGSLHVDKHICVTNFTAVPHDPLDGFRG